MLAAKVYPIYFNNFNKVSKLSTIKLSDETQSDLTLVEKAKAGDVSAFKDLVIKYQSKAYSIAKGIIKNPSDAEDIAQEAFIKAYRNLGNFRGESSFYTWFYRIIFNLAIDFSRKKYRKVESAVGDSNEISKLNIQENSEDNLSLKNTQQTPDQLFFRQELQKQIAIAMDGLSEEHRSIIFFREIEGLSYTEIAEVVGCSLGTVMSRLHHARKKMKEALNDYVNGNEGAKKIFKNNPKLVSIK